MKLRAGDWVEVRSKEEILATLDKRGRMEELPFMPQMFQYCGQRFQVYKRAHKTCDWVYTKRSRRLANGIHLETRCDGEAYGGCKAGCLIYWKEAWLKRVTDGKQSAGSSEQSRNLSALPLDPSNHRPLDHNDSAFCTEADVLAGTRTEDGKEEIGETVYVCQGTHLPNFTTSISGWDIRQYLEDYTSGNVTINRMFKGFVYAAYFKLTYLGSNIPGWWRYAVPAFNWIYDCFQGLWGGVPYPIKEGTIPADQPTPTVDLNLQPGELVRVKTYQEILATLDTNGKNRGLRFDAEMVPYCGGTYQVRSLVDKFIDEKTCRLVIMKKPSIILEGVWCQSRYSRCRMFCPRSIYSWWHEIWLERVPSNSVAER